MTSFLLNSFIFTSFWPLLHLIPSLFLKHVKEGNERKRGRKERREGKGKEEGVLNEGGKRGGYSPTFLDWQGSYRMWKISLFETKEVIR